MKILHIASFSGNVGDNANHNGLRCKLAKVLGVSASYDELEIRQFYRNYDGEIRRTFDDDFVHLANKYDLVIIGGGNFFEISIENSSTGCTIDIPEPILAQLRCKVLFFGLGFDCYKGYSDRTLSAFLRFILSLQDRKRFMITVRNDGSLEQFIRMYGSSKAHLLRKVPDGGFFVQPDDSIAAFLPRDKYNIILSLACDMPDVRFGAPNAQSGYKVLLESFVGYIKGMISINKNVFFTIIPHIYSDLGIIRDVLFDLPDFIRRNSIAVGPYLVGHGAEHPVFGAYKNADCVLGMRFHSNVCAIGLQVPTIGISTYKKITDLYYELKLPHRLVEAGNVMMSEILEEKSLAVMKNKTRFIRENRKVIHRLEAEMDVFLSDFSGFVKG